MTTNSEIPRNIQWAKDNPERVREHKRRWLRANPEKRSEVARAYREKNLARLRDVVYRATRAWMAANPEKRRCHKAVYRAIKNGTLVKQPCEACGRAAQAHHEDYSKPLEVRWLCRVHHGEAHRKAV